MAAAGAALIEGGRTVMAVTDAKMTKVKKLRSAHQSAGSDSIGPSLSGRLHCDECRRSAAAGDWESADGPSDSLPGAAAASESFAR